ncbi:MAG: ribokinase [Dehalococcoidia bacterium]
MYQKPKISVFGSLNMDLVVKSLRLPKNGETIRGDSFNTTPGGKGANQAVAASKMGANTEMIGRVGDDLFGKQLISYLNSQNVGTDSINIDQDSHSGIAIINIDSASGENRIIVVSGANMECGEFELEIANNLISQSDCLMIQLEIPKQISLAASQIALTHGIRSILDPVFTIKLDNMDYKKIDIITPNQTEAEFYTGIKIVDTSSAEKASKKFLEWGVNLVVIKMGEAGAFFASAQENGLIEGFKTSVLDTTGAGDAFNAAFAIGISKGSSIPEAIKFGNAAGAIAVSKEGAQEAMPSSEEIIQLLSKN